MLLIAASSSRFWLASLRRMCQPEIAPTTQTPNSEPATAAKTTVSEVSDIARADRISIASSVKAKPNMPANATVRQ